MTLRPATCLAAILVANVVASASARAEAIVPWKDERHVYASTCRYCHESGVGPELYGRKLEIDYVMSVVRRGVAGMPPFRHSEVDDATLRKLAKYISESPAPATKGAAK